VYNAPAKVKVSVYGPQVMPQVKTTPFNSYVSFETPTGRQSSTEIDGYTAALHTSYMMAWAVARRLDILPRQTGFCFVVY
jgi:hypothetical protein